MHKIIFFWMFAALFIQQAIAQQNVSINSSGAPPHASAQLDVSSTNKGLLVPRMTSGQRTTIASPANGLLVFDTDTNSFWYYNGAGWTNLATNSSAWSVNGNVGTNPSSNFIGTNDNANLRFKLNGTNAGLLSINGNIFWGMKSGLNNSTGYSNLAIGKDALTANTTVSNLVAIGDSALYNNTGAENTAIGSKTLYSNNSGSRNTAVGFQSLYTNTIGYQNNAFGYQALFSNLSGDNNTAFGTEALYSNNTGYRNNAMGMFALRLNTSGFRNSAVGTSALYYNTTGLTNVAFGDAALSSNTSGSSNTAIGTEALLINSTGYSNVAVGKNALTANTTVSNLVAIGDSALYNNNTGAENTAIGSKTLYSNNSGSSNTAVGFQSLYTNTTGKQNNAYGYKALFSNSTGSYNTAVGRYALYSNSIGVANVAVGINALSANTNESYNTGIGNAVQTAPGVNNATAIGSDAVVNCSNCLVLGSVIGYGAATSDVNVGIGETNPGFPLNFKSAVGDKISFFNNSGAHYGIGVQNYLLQIHTDLPGSDIAFGYGKSNAFTEGMRITGTGNVGIGTTAPQSKLHIASGGVLKLYDASNSRYAQLYHSNGGNLHLDAYGGGSSYICWFGGGGLNVGNGTSGGYGPVYASAFTVPSSIHVKKNIAKLHYGLTQILQLQGKEYNYINDKTNHREIGLIAEEVESILPEVVYRSTNDKQIKGIDYSKLTPVLIEAVKELKKQIDELRKENEEIKKLLNK